MKKYLSILFTAIFAAMFVFSTTSCSKDDSATDVNIVGTWKSELVNSPFMGEDDIVRYWQFKENGTCVIVNVYEDYVDHGYGTWCLSENTLTFELEEEVEEEDILLLAVFRISLAKEFFMLSSMGGLITAKFKRVPDSEIEKYL